MSGGPFRVQGEGTSAIRRDHLPCVLPRDGRTSRIPSGRIRTPVLKWSADGASGIPRGALPLGHQQGHRHALSLVAQSIYGLRPSLHVLLRPCVRGTGRPSFRRPLRPVDPGEGQRRRRPRTGARAPELEARARCGRDRHRPLPARRGSLPAHASVHRAAGRGTDAAPPDHPRADDRSRRRRARRGGAPSGRIDHLLGPDAGSRGVAAHRARHGAAAAATSGADHARRRRHRRRRRHGANPARDLGLARIDGDRRACGPGCRGDRDLGEPAVPAARHPRALPGEPGTRLARPAPPLRAVVRRPRLPRQARAGRGPTAGQRAAPPDTTCATVGR